MNGIRTVAKKFCERVQLTGERMREQNTAFCSLIGARHPVGNDSIIGLLKRQRAVTPHRKILPPRDLAFAGRNEVAPLSLGHMVRRPLSNER